MLASAPSYGGFLTGTVLTVDLKDPAAMAKALDKIVAVKVLSAQRTQDADAVGRFKREMRAVGKLDHPHIVRAMDAGEVDGEHFLVMEYVQGSDLSQLIQQQSELQQAREDVGCAWRAFLVSWRRRRLSPGHCRQPYSKLAKPGGLGRMLRSATR